MSKISSVIIFLMFSLLLWQIGTYSLFPLFDLGFEYSYIQIILSIILLVAGRVSGIKNDWLLILIVLLAILAKYNQTNIPSDERISLLLRAISMVPIFWVDKKTFKIFVYASTATILLFSLFLLRNSLVLHESTGNRGGLHFVTVGLLLISCMLSDKKPQKWIITAYILFFIGSLVFTSRTASIALLISFVLYYFLYSNNSFSNKTFLKVLFFAVLVFLSFKSESFQEYFIYKGRGEISGIEGSGRSDLWNVAISNLSLWGCGADYIEYLLGFGNAHNGYIQAFLSFGSIFGAIYCIWIIYYLVFIIRRYKDIELLPLLICFVPILFLGYAESNFIFEFGYPYIGFAFFMVIGQIARYKNNIEV